jgi:hypothetical protein
VPEISACKSLERSPLYLLGVSMVSGVFSNRDFELARKQRRAAARAALDEMEGHHGSVAWIDDRLDFLAEDISE